MSWKHEVLTFTSGCDGNSKLPPFLKWMEAKENRLKNHISIRGNPQTIFCREKTNSYEKICFFLRQEQKVHQIGNQNLFGRGDIYWALIYLKTFVSTFFCKDFLHRIQMFGKTIDLNCPTNFRKLNAPCSFLDNFRNLNAPAVSGRFCTELACPCQLSYSVQMTFWIKWIT